MESFYLDELKREQTEEIRALTPKVVREKTPQPEPLKSTTPVQASAAPSRAASAKETEETKG